MTDFATLEARARPLLDQVTTLAGREPEIAAILGIGVTPSVIAPLLAAILAGASGDAAMREPLRKEALAIFTENADALDAALTDIFTTAAKDYAPGQEVTTLLYSRGIHALLAHRVSNALWQAGRRDMALVIKTVLGRAFATDIHPAATIGRGIWLDHGVGFVVGETAVIEDDVSILHDVTLGGTGKENEDRHPKIRHGVLIGAGAKILGNIEVGHCARIAAGSVVVKPVPNNVTVAGVPAKIVGAAGCSEPSRTMNQMLNAMGL